MTATKTRTRYRCLGCGDIALKWAGKCDGCGEWNTLELEVDGPAQRPSSVSLTPASPARPITDVPIVLSDPRPTGVAEFDRVLGGGLVPGSVTLVGGEPGIGKSTLLLQVTAHLARAGHRALYVTAEESAHQVRHRAERLGAACDELYLAAETDLPRLLGHIEATGPEVLVVDSVQTMSDPALPSAAGSVAQVRAVASELVRVAKERDLTVVLVGHVTKDGGLAGPRVLEHIVDTVISFEGDRHHALRLLRATKHRFGSTLELGLLALGDGGLDPVADPSGMFLADRRPGESGSIVTPTLEGRRPLLVELQALVAGGQAVHPQRSTQGVDGGRVGLLLAVLDKRVGLSVLAKDVYVTAVGGAKVTEPAVDLPLAVAIASSMTDRPVASDVVACGEVGLGGELRSVAGLDRRLAEAARLGFRRAIVPWSTPEIDAEIVVSRVETLCDALRILDLVGGR